MQREVIPLALHKQVPTMQRLLNFDAYAGYLFKIDGNADVYCRCDTLALR